MADLLLLCVLLLVAGTPPAPLQGLYSTTTRCDDKLVSFSPCISFSPSNISGSPLILYCCDNFAAAIDDNAAISLKYIVHNPAIAGFPINSTNLRSFSPYVFSSPNNIISSASSIQCCDNFAAAMNDNTAIFLHCIVENPPILGFPINSTKLMSIASGYPVKEQEGDNSLSLESLISGFHETPTPQQLGSSSSSSSTTRTMCYCQLWVLLAGLISMANLEDNNNVDEDIDELENLDNVDDIPHLVPIYRWIENVDTLVATIDIMGCIGFTSFYEAVKLSHPNGGDDDWHGCVLWPWRGDRMNYLSENGQLLNPLENSWIDFSQQLFLIRVEEENAEEPTIGLVLTDVGSEDLNFDVLVARRYAVDSTSFAIALHYMWSSWSTVEPFSFDQLEQINIAPQAHIQYFDINKFTLIPPPLLPLPVNFEDWHEFIDALHYITIEQ